MLHAHCENWFFTFRIGVTNRQPHHEAVELGFGKRKRSVMLMGILRRDNKKRSRQGKSLVVERDLTLIHRFQKSALCARRGAVELISQNHLVNNGACSKFKGLRVRVQ